MTRWLSPLGYLYHGDMQPGDRAATSDEIAAAQALQPPDLNAGLAIISTATSALNATYVINPPQMMAEVLYIQVTTSEGAAKFSNGQTTKAWPDIGGAFHTFTTAQFITLAKACAQYVDAVLAQIAVVQASGTPIWPTQPMTIP